MLHYTPSTVRRRSASLLVHNEHFEDFTPLGIHGEIRVPSSYPDFRGESPGIDGVNSVDERDTPHSTCGHHACDIGPLRFCETPWGMHGDGHVSHHQEDSDCPPAFSDLQRPPATRPNAEDLATLSPSNRVDHGHPRLLASGLLKFTHKWPAPSTLKHLAVSGDPPAVQILEHGQGSALPGSGRWTCSKIWLFLSTVTVFTYGTMLLLWASVTWFDAWPHADVMAVADHDILVVITVAAMFLVFSSMVGISGTMLNSRPWLAIYTLLLWPDQIMILAVGYAAYKRVTFNFDRNLYSAWSRLYTAQGRQVIQDSFGCCGFYNTMHEPTPSKRCYLRASIPGCRDALFDFERRNLDIVWKVAFALAAIHIVNVIIALLCSNHVNKRFGKGLTPPRYRLCSDDIKAEPRGVGAESGLDGHPLLQDTMQIGRHSKGEVD